MDYTWPDIKEIAKKYFFEIRWLCSENFVTLKDNNLTEMIGFCDRYVIFWSQVYQSYERFGWRGFPTWLWLAVPVSLYVRPINVKDVKTRLVFTSWILMSVLQTRFVYQLPCITCCSARCVSFLLASTVDFNCSCETTNSRLFKSII